MTSSGTSIVPETARRFPVRALESGPAAGALMSAHHGRTLGHPDLLSFDMGGTTAKGALVRGFTALKQYDLEVGRVHEFKSGSGLPVKLPVIDMIEIGSGGGSLARVDERGLIRVGPKSAGADPGPACYAKGGTRPTLTDADVVLGYLDPEFFLGGEMRLDVGAARTAIEEHVARAAGLDPIRAAWGVYEIANEDVARAFRVHASERGFDYRRSSMVAFGGSGPVHALAIARKLRIPRVIFPIGAEVMSALGLLVSPLGFEIARSRRVYNEVGARQLLEFMDEYGLDDLGPLSAAIRGQSERAIRDRIAALPDGVYKGVLDIEGIDDALRLACRAEIDGGGIKLDFAGTSPPVDRGINVPLCYTRAMARYAVKCLTVPGMPNNEGAVAPIRVGAPQDCILNAQPPCPTGARHVTGHMVVPPVSAPSPTRSPARSGRTAA